jgi:hypothetical protein
MGAGAAGERRCWRLDAQGEVDFVVQRDAVVAGPRDLRLLLAGKVDRARPQLGQPEPAALVEPERVDVVVGGGEPDLAAAEAPRRAAAASMSMVPMPTRRSMALSVTISSTSPSTW